MKLKIEDIFFWVLISAVVAVILWLFRGSPTLENSIISIGLFIVSSELLLWRKLFEIDKNTAISFAKLKSEINILNVNQKDTKKELVNIKELIKSQ